MFDIFIKPSTIIVDAFTFNPALHKHFPVLPASQAMPNWYKKMHNSFTVDNGNGIKYQAGTLKRCDGLISLYKRGLCVPMWADLILETKDTGEYKYQFSADEVFPIVDHPRQQFDGNFENMIHVKMLSPWLLKEKSGVDFLFAPATWNLGDRLLDLNVPPGIVNYKDQHSTHVNMLLPRRNKRIELFSEDIITHIIPLSDKRLKIKNHLISREEWDNIHLSYSYHSSFTGRHKKNLKRTMKE